MGDLDRVAAAPVSWGVNEVPGWGFQLDSARVLAEMAQIGLRATEFGPDTFLPVSASARSAVLAGHGLRGIGGFTPVVLHDSAIDPLVVVAPTLSDFASQGAEVMVLAAATGLDGYNSRPELDESGWRVLLGHLDLLAAAAAERGVTAVLHPHVGTMVESVADVTRVLEGSSVAICLDTGHLLIGGTDPAELARDFPARVAHTHLKDVDATLAARVRAGEATFHDAVRAGMFRPLGAGDADIAGVIGHLERHGYDGWYVLEQDCVLAGEPRGEGPAADVHTSATFVAAALADAGRQRDR